MEQVRRFNRTVTQRAGALNDRFLSRDRPLAMSRLLWEIGTEGSEIVMLSPVSTDQVKRTSSDLLPEAIELYRSSGYVEVPPFNDEPFADRWFTKSLLH